MVRGHGREDHEVHVGLGYPRHGQGAFGIDLAHPGQHGADDVVEAESFG